MLHLSLSSVVVTCVKASVKKEEKKEEFVFFHEQTTISWKEREKERKKSEILTMRKRKEKVTRRGKSGQIFRFELLRHELVKSFRLVLENKLYQE